MDEVELPQHARDARTGLRRLAPEIEAARDKIIDHFEDKPFAELKEFVQKLLETEEDETKRLGALAARVYLLRKRIIDFEETVEFVPASEPLGELDVADDDTAGRSWARVRVLENCEVNDMRLPEGIIVDVSAADAQRLIDAGHAELREAADPELSEEDAVSEDDTVSEEDAVSEDDTVSEEDAAPESAQQSDADEDIQEETGKEIEAEAAEATDDTVADEIPEAEEVADETVAEEIADEISEAKEVADEIPEAEEVADETVAAESTDETVAEEMPESKNATDEADVEAEAADETVAAETEADVEPNAETRAAVESAGDIPEPIDEASEQASNEADVELLDTEDHVLATAIAETAEAFKEIDEALASDSAEESAVSDNKNGESGENDGNEASDETEKADET